jgi:hypothetical protein
VALRDLASSVELSPENGTADMRVMGLWYLVSVKGDG